MAKVKALAGGLTERGFGKGATVAIMAPNMPEFATVFHAVAWAGGTVTTVNPSYTAQELNHQLMASAATLLVTVPQLADTAREGMTDTGVRALAVIGPETGAAGDTQVLADLMGAPVDAQVPVDLDGHIVLLPYSSGSTGLPKGVMLSHRNLVANLDQILAVAEILPGEMTPGFLPFFHIYGLQVLLNTYLAAGAGVVTMPRFDLEQFLTLTQQHRARRLLVVPPVAIALAKHPMVDRFDLSSVQHVASAAAPLGAELGDAVGRRLGCVTMQGYGMTEMSRASHFSPVSAPRAGSVGITVPGTECRIVEPSTGADAGPGEEGELWVRGPQVMKGYLNNPEATAACLDAEGWLRTGDIAQFDADGYLFIRDRLKELIKVKGFQVAPAELEAVLLAHPDIADAAVIGVPDDEAGEVPAAFLVAAGDRRLTCEDLDAWFEGKLPLQAGAAARVSGRDPEIGLGQDLAAPSPFALGAGGATRGSKARPQCRGLVGGTPLHAAPAGWGQYVWPNGRKARTLNLRHTEALSAFPMIARRPYSCRRWPDPIYWRVIQPRGTSGRSRPVLQLPAGPDCDHASRSAYQNAAI
jgi:4-coumarate--CoA ligase